MSRLRDLLLDSASRLFAEAAEPRVQEAVESGTFPAELWQEIEDNGLSSALLPEELGGAAVDLADGLAVLRLAGAFALPLPLAETMIGRLALASAGLAIPETPLALALGTPRSPLGYEIGAEATTLCGRVTIPWPERVRLVVVALGEAGERVACIEPAGGEPGTNFAGEPVAALPLEGIRVGDGQWAPAAPGQGQETLLHLAAAGRTQMLAGGMERILDLTIEHAQGRVQFGRAISRFQAVQQLIAQLAAEVAAVGVAADAAANALVAASRLTESRQDGHSPNGARRPGSAAFPVAAAKARAGEAATKVTRIAHQIHGAIGYTREHVLHRFTRRLWLWRDDYGDEGDWQAEAGHMALTAGDDGLWDLLCSS